MCQISMAEKFLNIPVKMVDQLLYVLGLVWLAFQWLLWDVCIISEYLFILLLLICFFYIRTMMICFKAIRFRFPDSKVLLLGFTFLFAGIVAESMASQQLFYFSNSAQIGFTLMAFVLLITITRRHGIAIKFTRVARENLAMEMKERRKEVTMLHEQIAEKNLQIKKLKKRGQKSPARHE